MNTFAILSLFALSLVLVNCESFNLPRNCSSDSVAVAAEFLAHDCNYISTPKCLQSFMECYANEGLDVQIPIEMCAKELNVKELADTAKFMSTACNTNGPDYYKTLEVFCCIKTKEVMRNQLTWTKLRDTTKKCLDRVNCPGE